MHREVHQFSINSNQYLHSAHLPSHLQWTAVTTQLSSSASPVLSCPVHLITHAIGILQPIQPPTMRLLHLLTTALLPLATLAAKKDTTSIDRYASASTKSTPLKLADKSYDALTKAPRDYSVAVLLTAMGSQFGCVLCQEFQPEWEMLAKSWRSGDKKGESRLLFGTLDFSDGKGTFQSLQLQTAPVLLLFHPTTGPHARNDKPMERLDFNTG